MVQTSMHLGQEKKRVFFSKAVKPSPAPPLAAGWQQLIDEPKATTAPALALSDAGDQTLGLTPVLVAATYGQTKAWERL